MQHTPGRHHHVLLGFILILLGVLFLLGMLDVVDFGNLIGTWWPLILIAVGLRKMATQGSGRYTGDEMRRPTSNRDAMLTWFLIC